MNLFHFLSITILSFLVFGCSEEMEPENLNDNDENYTFHPDSLYRVSKIEYDDNYYLNFKYENDTISSFVPSNFYATKFNWENNQLVRIKSGSDGYDIHLNYQNGKIYEMDYQWSVIMGDGSIVRSYFNYKANELIINDSLIWISRPDLTNEFLKKSIITYENGNIVSIIEECDGECITYNYEYDDGYSPFSECVFYLLNFENDNYFPTNIPLPKNNVVRLKKYDDELSLIEDISFDIKYDKESYYPIEYNNISFEYISLKAK